MHLKEANELANSVGSDQKEQSYLSPHCLLRTICPNIQNSRCKFFYVSGAAIVKLQALLETEESFNRYAAYL